MNGSHTIRHAVLVHQQLLASRRVIYSLFLVLYVTDFWAINVTF